MRNQNGNSAVGQDDLLNIGGLRVRRTAILCCEPEGRATLHTFHMAVLRQRPNVRELVYACGDCHQQRRWGVVVVNDAIPRKRPSR